MAAVPNQVVPSVAPPAAPPDTYQRIQTSPDEFGAGIAQGLERIGQGALAASRFFGEVAADDAYNQYASRVQKLLAGDPEKTVIGPDGTPQPDLGYLGLRGRDALDAHPQVAAEMERLRNELRAGMQTPAQQLMFDRETRRLQSYKLGEAARHAEGQANVWYGQVEKDSIENGKTEIRDSAMKGDAEGVQRGTAAIMRSYLRNAQRTMGSSLGNEGLSAALNRGRADATEAEIEAILPTNPTRAMEILQSPAGSLLKGPRYDALHGKLERAGNQALAGSLVNNALGIGGGAAGRAGTPAVSSRAVNETIPPEGRALLDTIAGPESKGAYNVRYTPSGGATFEGFADHPRIAEPGPAGPSTAAGRYQITASTWDANAPPGADFSPANQDAAAWKIAQDAYREQTGGGDLLAALKEGKTTEVQQALRSSRQWDTADLRSFGANLAKYNGAAPASPETPPVVRAVAAVTLPPGNPAPGAAEIAAAQSENAVAHARALQNLADDPRAAANPTAAAAAERQLNLRYQSRELALTGQMKAITETRNLAANEYVQRMMRAPADPQILQDMTDDGRLDATTRNHLWSIYRTGVKKTAEGDLDKYGPKFFEVYSRVTAPITDPNKLRDPSEIYALAVPRADGGQDLTIAGVDKLTQELQRQKELTPGGELLARRRADFLKSVEPLIDKSNPIMGKIDQSGKQQAYAFSFAVDQKIDEYRAAGKDPATLFTPGSPDYMGRPQVIEPYQKPLQQSVKDQVSRLTGKPAGAAPAASPAAPVASAPIPPAVPLRQPGESAADYMRRIGQGVPIAPAAPAIAAPVR